MADRSRAIRFHDMRAHTHTHINRAHDTYVNIIHVYTHTHPHREQGFVHSNRV